MSPVTDLYRSRLISQEELITRLRPGNSITLGTWMGQPHGFMQALARYGKEIDPLYVSCSPASANGEFLSQPNIRCLSTFLGYYERMAHRQRHNVMYTPLQYTDARNSVRSNRPPDYLIVRTASLDERGRFNLSLSNSWLQDAIGWYARNAPATRIVVEVNPHMPPIRGLPQFGSNEIPLSDVHHVVEDDTPIPDFATPESSDVDRAIAANVAALVEDRATIQLGFGTIPMVIGRLLAERKELGIHTEMFCQSHVDLIEAGSVSNAHKGLYDGFSVGTFALGERRLYRWLTDNPAFAMLPVEETNAVPVLARVRKMTSINSILTVDLNGQACAHCIGPETYSGLGGAFEFAYGSQLSPGGKSILCLPSKTRLRDGREVSNIVARYPAGTRVTIPEHCVDWVVTEYGAVRLKFLSQDWRASALIAIAHPQYRDELGREAAANGLNLAGLTSFRRPPEHFFSK
jgi:4-hydroxybutyrate CoA-transferase